MGLPKVSCICPTRGRFDTLREAVSFFLLQDYSNKELIIFNNHPEPIKPHPKLAKHNIRIINAGDYSGKSMQKVYADCLNHVSDDSEYIAVWDDDDMYFPWHLSDNINKLSKSSKSAIRPYFGYWQDINHSAGLEFTIICNTLEAGMIAKRGTIFFNESHSDQDSPEYTHPHIYWTSSAERANQFEYNFEISAIFRWGYGKSYHHLQSVGPHLNNDEIGKGDILRPCKVGHLFHNFIMSATLTTINKDVICLSNSNRADFLKRLLDCDIHRYDHVDKYNAWLYWDKSTPAFISACHQSIIQNTFANVKVITDADLSQFSLPEYFWKHPAVQRSDYLRIHFLLNYGGWWFDSDTYVVGDLDQHYFKYLSFNETVFPWEYDVAGNMTTPIFSSRPHCHIIKEAYRRIDQYLKTDPTIGWSEIGVNGIIKAVDVLKHRGEWHLFGLPEIAKYGYNNDSIKAWDFNSISPNKLQMIIFHWSQIGAEMSWKINVSPGDSIDKIGEQYPNLQRLFEISRLPYSLDM